MSAPVASLPVQRVLVRGTGIRGDDPGHKRALLELVR